MKKILITGVTGFAGSFLAEHLLSLHNEEQEIHGTYLSDSSLENVNSIKDQLSLVKIDLTDSASVDSLIESVKPHEVYHLAALPSPADSYEDPSKYIHNNVDVQLHLLEAIKKYSSDTRIVIISSGEIYGQVDPDQLPLDENTPFRPTSPYSVSKATQDLLALQYYISYKLPIIRVRPFNHIGPRQSPAFVVASFAKQIAEIEKQDHESVIKVGNLSARRDFTDVRDTVRAYQIAMEKGIVGEVYNIGSGESVPIQKIVDTLITMSDKDLKIEVDQSRLRPSDIPDIVCDASKIQSLGWSTQISLEQTLEDTLAYWRGQV
ncbi:MAG TPA: GDP-mannose 4,6-dehydratase [Candidatus Levybacteria bacterium]|nr:GDP-mannose 4,6-dehydratase [Candidatus Levybacteria bacterium]